MLDHAHENTPLVLAPPRTRRCCCLPSALCRCSLSDNTKHLLKWSIPAFIVSVPTGFLNFLNALDIKIGEATSFDDLISKVRERNGSRIAEAVGSAFGAIGVNTAVNIVFLPDNLTVTAKTFKDLGIFIVNGFKINILRRPGRVFNDDHIEGRKLFATLICVLCVIPTMAAYGGVGMDSFGFSRFLAWLVFILNAITYGATRLNGLRVVSMDLLDPDTRLLNRHLSDLENIVPRDPNNPGLRIPISDSHSREAFTQALAEYLRYVEAAKRAGFTEGTPFTRNFLHSLLRVLKLLLLAPCAIVTGIVAEASMIHSALDGSAAATGATVLKEQGLGQLIYAWIGNLPTAFFFARAVYLLPGEIARTLKNLSRLMAHPWENKYKIAVHIALLALEGYLCYISGAGMAEVAASSIAAGYLDYLGKLLFNKDFYYWVAYAGAAIINFLSCLRITNNYSLDPSLENARTLGHDEAILLLKKHRHLIDVDSLALSLRQRIEGLDPVLGARDLDDRDVDDVDIEAHPPSADRMYSRLHDEPAVPDRESAARATSSTASPRRSWCGWFSRRPRVTSPTEVLAQSDHEQPEHKRNICILM